jgi:hypothetical protein
MKGVVQPAPDLQMFVGRGQVKKEGLPYVLALPPDGMAFSFPVVTCGRKDFFPLGIGERLIRPELRGHLSTIKGSLCPWRSHLFMFIKFHLYKYSNVENFVSRFHRLIKSLFFKVETYPKVASASPPLE